MFFLLVSSLILSVNAKRSRAICTDNRSGRCQEVSQFISFTNSWICRSCFNIRTEFTFNEANIPDFHAEDNVVFAFTQPVIVVKFAYPAVAIEDYGTDSAGNYLFLVKFDRNVEFGDRRLDFNAEFREWDQPPQVAYAYSCPCKNNGRVIPAPTAAPLLTPAMEDIIENSAPGSSEAQSDSANFDMSAAAAKVEALIPETPNKMDLHTEKPKKKEKPSKSEKPEKPTQEFCTDLANAAWETDIDEGTWNCDSSRPNRVTCELTCDDEYNSNARTVCHTIENGEFFNEWKVPTWPSGRWTVPDCTSCSESNANANMPIVNGGVWNCYLKPNRNRTVRECKVLCPGNLKPNGKIIIKCRSQDGWKFSRAPRSVRAGTEAVTCQ